MYNRPDITAWFSGNNQEVDILVNGRPVKVHGSEGKSFVEARHGAQYSIRLRNNHSHRVLAIVSVDGIDVLTGKPATADSSGYVIPAYGTYNVPGFRVSDNEVNKFEFADKEKSYAKLGEDGEQSTANCGVIAVRFIHEKQRQTFVKRYLVPPAHEEEWPRPRPYRSEPLWMSSMENERGVSDNTVQCMNLSMSAPLTKSATRATSRAGGCSADVGEFDMGTKFSEETVYDKVSTTTFERGEDASSHTFYYASRRQLEAFGVEFEPKPKVAFPEPFKPSGYCRPPKKR